MKVVIVIPTYNEAENIGRMIDALELEFPKMPQHDFHILVVEGNSPDGTAEVVRKQSEIHSNVHLLMEPAKRGLGAAYILGFEHAMHNMGADVLMEMDADFQHDPKDVVRLIAEIDKGNDYVLGSRYIKGGSIPKEWVFRRKFLSVGGSIFSKLVLWMWDINDFTSGFRASRVKGFVDKLDWQNVLSNGFAYKFYILHEAKKLGLKVKEIPIKFGVRDRGDSKMEADNARDSMRVVLTLRYRENPNFFKFLAVGMAGLVSDLTLSNIFRLVLPFQPNTSAACAAFLATLVTFTLNNFWSFKDRRIEDKKKLAFSFVLYFASSAVPILFRYVFVGIMFRTFPGFTGFSEFILYNFSLFVSILFGLIWNYTVYSRFIWRKTNA